MNLQSKRIDDRREEMYKERIQDTYGWFLEAFTEYDYLKLLKDEIVAGDAEEVLARINDMLTIHCYPSELEAEEELLNNGFGRDDL
jgi:hypothetical protein